MTISLVVGILLCIMLVGIVFLVVYARKNSKRYDNMVLERDGTIRPRKQSMRSSA